MPLPKDLPGFYFDPEKNRYFPIKGPIPGRKRQAPLPPCNTSSGDVSHEDRHVEKRLTAAEMLKLREMNGGFIRGYNFVKEYQKLQVSHPLVWIYQTGRVADTALEQLHCIVQTPRGLKEKFLLSTGNIAGSVSLYDVGKPSRAAIGCKYQPKPVWPVNNYADTIPEDIWSTPCHWEDFSSQISCMRKSCKHSNFLEDGSLTQYLLLTTLGSGVSGGSVYVLMLNEPLDSMSASGLHRRMVKISTLNCTLWTADCNLKGTEAAVGTNRGAAVINIETGRLSWTHRSKSDILSQQFDRTGNVVLCGLRNGAIIPVDIRQRQVTHAETAMTNAARMVRSPHRMTFRGRISLNELKYSTAIMAKKEGIITIFASIQLKWNFKSLSMPSAVCSLVGLRSDDRYFLGSSMDGSIKLFDYRLLNEAVQSYEGHANSHSYLQLGVDPSESFLISGGEDCFVRIWSIKSGERIFAEKVSSSILSTVCWPQVSHRSMKEIMYESTSKMDHSWGAWLGSLEGLFYMHGS